MSDNVIPFGGITKLNLSPDKVIEAAKGELEDIVILGYTKEGEEYFASSIANGPDVNWLLDRCKERLLNVDFDVEEGEE